jgi:hypothetical protein
MLVDPCIDSRDHPIEESTVLDDRFVQRVWIALDGMRVGCWMDGRLVNSCR